MPGRVNKISIEKIAQALINSGGFISGAAEQLKLTPQNLCNKIAKSKKLQDVRDQQREKYLDLAETKLIEAIKAGAPWAICFYLKCKGKERGYIEHQKHEVTGADGQPLVVQVVKFADVKDENTK